jgi:hypothetical protein
VAELLGQCLAHVQQPDTVPAPAAPRRPAGRALTPQQRIVARGCLILLGGLVLIAACLIFGPFLLRYAGNEAALELNSSVPLVVKRGGEVVATLDAVPGMSFTESGEHSFTLPPGTYDVEVVAASSPDYAYPRPRASGRRTQGN